ncbi:GxxExxY protein [Niabella ginsenosidivorans]|uniref:GxxExxY protein n=1 Tax=Niabella ginsenosidivorans TaxID=1176587 RepID=UPI0029371FF7|nr:GxxExxY protein [Niabella ginsenosidivorans]
MCYELTKAGIPFKRQHGIPVIHEGLRMQVGFRADLIVYEKVLFELKSIEAVADVHYKQVLTYLKLTNLKPGILVNFNVSLLKDGIKRIVNKL